MTESWPYGAEAEQIRKGTFPWPPAEDESILAAFGETWKSATFDPARFFARLPRSDGIAGALIYYLVIGILVAGASLFWEMSSVMVGAMDVLYGDGGSPIEPVVGFLLSPILLVGLLFVSAGITHLLLLFFSAGRHGYGTTVRVFCYAYSPAIFGVVPLLGSLVGSIWTLVIVIIGLREAHGTETWKAGVSVLLPFVIMMGLALLLAAIALAAVGAAL